jgi:uncharacterized protein (TIGR02001 family)
MAVRRSGAWPVWTPLHCGACWAIWPLVHERGSETVRYVLAIAVPAALFPAAAMAQGMVGFEASILSDYRERGLSWSDGKAAAQARVDVQVPVTGLRAAAQVSSTRQSPRHGDADAAVELSVTYEKEMGLARLHGAAVSHLFADGRGKQDYFEFDLGAGVALGPIDLAVLGSYAPPQDAIGGSNLYGKVSARLALIGTPVTLAGHFGHSSGHVDDPVRAGRLRPGGSYSDWSLGADYAMGKAVFSLTYSDTDIRRREIRFPENAGDRGAALVLGAHLIL